MNWHVSLRVAASALVAFVLAHDVIFLVTYRGGTGAALLRSGHDERWTSTVIVVAVLAVGLLATGVARLVELARLAGALDTGSSRIRHGRTYLLRHLLRGWLIVFTLTVVLFLGVENLEHLSVGLPAPGLGVLRSPEYQAAPLILAAVSLLVALVEALYRWRHEVLVARIAAARARWARSSGAAARPWFPWVERRHRSIAGHHVAGRAPPLTAAH